MSIVLFTIVNWDNKEEADELKPILSDWNNRSTKYFHPSHKYIIAGSYSDPKYNPLPEIPLIQSGFEKQFFPKIPMNYWKIGLMTALHNFLSLNISWDLIVYYHYCLLTSIDFTDIYNEFQKTTKSICSLNRITPYGTVLDTGLMIMKRSAVQKWILNSSAGFGYNNGKKLTVEEEATRIFDGDIYNPLPSVISMHRYQSGSKNPLEDMNQNPFEKRFDLTKNEFIKNPIIFGYRHHCLPNELNEWKLNHPYKI